MIGDFPKMDQFLYSVYTVTFIVLTAWSFRVWQQSKSIGTLMMVLVNAAMIYENGILALGVLIGHGALLEALSWGRFIGYAVFPAFLVITGLDLAKRSGAKFAANRNVWMGAWVFVFALIAFALLVEVIGRQLEPRELNGVIRYMWVNKGVPPLGVILMNMSLIGLGVVVWRKAHSPILLLGSTFLLAGDGIAAGRYVLGSGIELCFMVALLAAEIWMLRHYLAPQARLQTRAVGD